MPKVALTSAPTQNPSMIAAMLLERASSTYTLVTSSLFMPIDLKTAISYTLSDMFELILTMSMKRASVSEIMQISRLTTFISFIVYLIFSTSSTVSITNTRFYRSLELSLSTKLEIAFFTTCLSWAVTPSWKLTNSLVLGIPCVKFSNSFGSSYAPKYPWTMFL